MSQLKTLIQVYKDDYAIDDFEKIADTISSTSENKFSTKKIKNTLSKYAILNNPRISFNTDVKNYNMSYKKLCKFLEIRNRRTEILENLLTIKNPEQRSKEWFEMRENRITASDGAAIINLNKYEQFYNVIRKKVFGSTFKGNYACYHGTKFERVAILIYELRNNVKLSEFGLIPHPSHSFLGASPDAIVSKYTLDGNLTDKVGRMVEIKCPLQRFIKSYGEIKGGICPIYYWVQVQLQLECCNLDECDFWQCNIKEYESRDDFLQDSSATEYISKQTGFEKGCLIQLLPVSQVYENYEDFVINNAKFIYPDKINLTNAELDKWIITTLSNLKTTHKNYYMDRIIYWKLNNSSCVVINRDYEWFNNEFNKYKEIWDFIVFFRKNKDIAEKYFEYIDSNSNKTYEDIIKYTKIICNI